MRLVTAIIQPFMFDKLARALRKEHLVCFTACPVKSYGVSELESTIDLLSEKVRVDIVVPGEDAAEVAELIANTVGTHQTGDGMIYVSEITHAININTGKHDSEALL